MKVFAFVLVSLAITTALPVDDAGFATNITNLAHFRDIGGRIINGNLAGKNQFPWQAALYLATPGGTSFCGGSLISPTWILTAAHCVLNVQSVTVYLGIISLDDQNGRLVAQTKRSIVHSQYRSTGYDFDIALVELQSPVKLSSSIATIPLAGGPLGNGVKVTVSGWGKTSDASNSVSRDLNYVDLTTLSNDACKNTFGSIIQPGMVCVKGATNQSPCNGDSGGPLTTGFGIGALHVGLVSFGSTQCSVGLPAVFTRTASYRDWIRQNSGV